MAAGSGLGTRLGKSLLIVIVLCSLLELSAVSVHYAYGPLPVFKVAGTHYEVAVAIVRAECMRLCK